MAPNCDDRTRGTRVRRGDIVTPCESVFFLIRFGPRAAACSWRRILEKLPQEKTPLRRRGLQMKLKSVLLAGAVIPFMTVSHAALASESHSGMVLAQQQPAANEKNADKEKEKRGRPAGRQSAPAANPAHTRGRPQNEKAGKPAPQGATRAHEAPAGGKAQNNQPAGSPNRPNTRPAAQNPAPERGNAERRQPGKP